MKVSQASSPDGADPLYAQCPGRGVFETVTNRWTLLILWTLRDGTLRFFDIRDRVEGISERVLSQNLKVLCRSGLLERHVEPSVPPKVSSPLPPIGRDLLLVMETLTQWIGDKLPQITEAEQRYDQVQRASG